MCERVIAMVSRLLIVSAVLVLLIAAMAADPVEAGKGGKGKGGGGKANPTLTVAPDPAPLGSDTIIIGGSGFRANDLIMVGPRGVIPTVSVRTDGSGAFSIAYTSWNPAGFSVAGEYPVDARRQNHKSTWLATIYFTVCPTNPCQ